MRHGEQRERVTFVLTCKRPATRIQCAAALKGHRLCRSCSSEDAALPPPKIFPRAAREKTQRREVQRTACSAACSSRQQQRPGDAVGANDGGSGAVQQQRAGVGRRAPRGRRESCHVRLAGFSRRRCVPFGSATYRRGARAEKFGQRGECSRSARSSKHMKTFSW